MKCYAAPSACYALALALWLLSANCERRAWVLADLQILVGDDWDV